MWKGFKIPVWASATCRILPARTRPKLTMLRLLASVLLICFLTLEVNAAKEKSSLKKQVEELRQEFEDFKNQTLNSGEVPTLGNMVVQPGGWLLAFRVVAGNKQPAYDTYMDTNRNDDDPLVRALTPCSCLSMNGTCSRQYRGSILFDWTQLPINKVRLSVYNGGKETAFAVFNGAGSTFTNWMAPERLEETSWKDLKIERTNFFSIVGDSALARRFFIHNVYPGCANDAGWLVVKDAPDTCSWGQLPATSSFPLILYSATGARVLYSSTAVSRADSLAIWVSLKVPENYGQKC